jgi:hypothetical protein
VDAGSPAKEACWNDARVVQDYQFVATEQVRELHEKVVFRGAGESREEKEAGSVAAIKRLLGDLAGGQMVIQVVEPHQLGVYQHLWLRDEEKEGGESLKADANGRGES